MLQCAAEGGGRCVRPRGERAFRALSLGRSLRDCGWQPPQKQHQQLKDNGRVVITGRGSPARRRWASLQPMQHAPARARPAGCPPARQSAEAAAAAPRGVTAPSQWLCWRRARDCTAGRRRAAREGRPGPPPAALALREGSLGLRPGVDGGIQMAASGGKGSGAGRARGAGHARPPPSPREGRLDAGLRAGRRGSGAGASGARSGSLGRWRRGEASCGRKASLRAGAGPQVSVAWRPAAKPIALSTASREGRPRVVGCWSWKRGGKPGPESPLVPAGRPLRPSVGPSSLERPHPPRPIWGNRGVHFTGACRSVKEKLGITVLSTGLHITQWGTKRR